MSLSSDDKREIIEEYGLDNLPDVREKANNILEEHTELDPDEKFITTAVASIRTAVARSEATGFPLMASELTKRYTIDHDKVREGLKVIKEEADWAPEYVSTETAMDYVALFLLNNNRSKDMVKAVQTLEEQVIEEEETGVKEILADFEPRVSAASILFIASMISPQDRVDAYDVEDISSVLQVGTHDVWECYREAWDKTGYRVKDEVLDETNVVAEVKSLCERVGCTEEQADACFYRAVYTSSERNNKAVAGAIVDLMTNIDSEKIYQEAEAPTGAIQRIQKEL